MAGGPSFAAVVVAVASFLLTAPAAVNGKEVKISTYWGTNSTEGFLDDACNSNDYNIINIGFVDTFGYGVTPTLNLDGHCDPTSTRDCKHIGNEIAKCRDEGVKVFISLGGPGGDYTLASEDDAKWVAYYVWNAFLDGNDPTVDRPFGDDPKAFLDGVDFFVESIPTVEPNPFWVVLVEALRNHTNSGSRQIELSATPKCSYPDKNLGPAIKEGYFDYVQVRFYNDSSCEYDGSVQNMQNAWYRWTEDGQVNKVFVGVTASPNDQGYVGTTALIRDFLGSGVVNSPHFGGLMVWYLLTDDQQNYSRNIRHWNSLIQTTSEVEIQVE